MAENFFKNVLISKILTIEYLLQENTELLKYSQCQKKKEFYGIGVNAFM